MKKYYLFKINVTLLNILNIVVLGLCVLFTWLVFPGMLRGMISLFSDMKLLFLLFPLLLFYFVFHEVLHAIGYIVNGADPKKITFGMELEKSVFYCLCKAEVTRRNILFSLMYPLFFIGIVTYAISAIFNLPILMLLSIANIGGAIGDIMYFMFIIRLDKNIKYSEMDDGTSFALLSEKDLSKYKPIGLDFVGVSDEISRNDFRRIYISKVSFIVLIIALLALVVGLFIF